MSTSEKESTTLWGMVWEKITSISIFEIYYYIANYWTPMNERIKAVQEKVSDFQAKRDEIDKRCQSAKNDYELIFNDCIEMHNHLLMIPINSITITQRERLNDLIQSGEVAYKRYEGLVATRNTYDYDALELNNMLEQQQQGADRHALLSGVLSHGLTVSSVERGEAKVHKIATKVGITKEQIRERKIHNYEELADHALEDQTNQEMEDRLKEELNYVKKPSSSSSMGAFARMLQAATQPLLQQQQQQQHQYYQQPFHPDSGNNGEQDISIDIGALPQPPSQQQQQSQPLRLEPLLR